MLYEVITVTETWLMFLILQPKELKQVMKKSFIKEKYMDHPQGVQITPTTVWSAGAGCHGACGQKLYVKDGQLIKVEGDENASFNQGRSCPRVLALTQYVYHPDRVTTPQKRVGARGEGKFVPISWDEAFDICEQKMKAIRSEYGAESIVFAQGTGRDSYNFV